MVVSCAESLGDVLLLVLCQKIWRVVGAGGSQLVYRILIDIGGPA